MFQSQGQGQLTAGDRRGGRNSNGARQTSKLSRNPNRDKEFAKLNENTDFADCGGGGIGSFFFRPPLIQFKNCTDVLIEGITTRNSPFWNTHILYCKNVTVKNATFQNPSDGINGDGLDIDSCDGVKVVRLQLRCERRLSLHQVGDRQRRHSGKQAMPECYGERVQNAAGPRQRCYGF